MATEEYKYDQRQPVQGNKIIVFFWNYQEHETFYILELIYNKPDNVEVFHVGIYGLGPKWRKVTHKKKENEFWWHWFEILDLYLLENHYLPLSMQVTKCFTKPVLVWFLSLRVIWNCSKFLPQKIWAWVNINLKQKFGNKPRKQLLARLKCQGEADSLKTKPLIECLSTHLWLERQFQ